MVLTKVIIINKDKDTIFLIEGINTSKLKKRIYTDFISDAENFAGYIDEIYKTKTSLKAKSNFRSKVDSEKDFAVAYISKKERTEGSKLIIEKCDLISVNLLNEGESSVYELIRRENQLFDELKDYKTLQSVLIFSFFMSFSLSPFDLYSFLFVMVFSIISFIVTFQTFLYKERQISKNKIHVNR